MNTVELIPIFSDNYVFLITNTESLDAIVIDPGEATEVLKVLSDRKLKLHAILTTHHHLDHIGGVAELKAATHCEVWAPLKNSNQISADHYVTQNEQLDLKGFSIQVVELPGHTLGHIAYYFTAQKWLFSGDVLFGLGCGRLFEGDYSTAFESLQKVKSFPDETKIFCAHEYTERNLQFCKAQNFPLNPELIAYEKELVAKRKLNLPSVPLVLRQEKFCNPFLLASTKGEFAKLRESRNGF